MNIRVRDLSFAYGNSPVLNGLNFVCESGQIVAILGENGSGKSTLLTFLAGLKDSMAVEWDGHVPSCHSLKERACLRTLVPQHSVFDASMTLYDYILMGRKPWFGWNESSGDHRIVTEMLQLFELTELAFRPLSNISGGERRKALLARAFAQDTPLLLLDEPLNNLDLRFQIKFLNLLKRRTEDPSMLIIIVLHDINAALNGCDSAVLLKKGRIIAHGLIEEAITSETVESMLGVKGSFYEINGRRQMAMPETV